MKINFLTIFFCVYVVALNALNLKKSKQFDIKHYVEKWVNLMEQVTDDYFKGPENPLIQTGINFDQFKEYFKNGPYGKMVEDIADEKFIKKYFDLFSKDGAIKPGDFFWFSSLYEIEGVLISAGIHQSFQKLKVTTLMQKYPM